MATTILAVAASSWAVVMGLSPVLQIRRMLREQSSRQEIITACPPRTATLAH